MTATNNKWYQVVNIDYECKTTTLHYHHSALSRGYQCKDFERVDHYNGRFGRGYVRHIPNAVNCIGTNNYHTIEYYVY